MIRSDVIARRFCEGESIVDIADSFATSYEDIEQALRRRLEVLLERKRK